MRKLNFKEAKHLVERTGFGAELERIRYFTGKSLESSVSTIFSKKVFSSVEKPSLLSAAKLKKAKKAFRQSGNRKKANQLYKKERTQLGTWGMKNLLESDNPLHERMVWFWHNHFTSSVQKVRTVDWMLQQDTSIREHALGSFATLLKTMATDPAMLIYLDGRSNKKGQANENFARELLELFTLGEGHYSEKDIKEAARAFTGWSVSAKKGKAVLRKKHHDKGVKTFMGTSGKLSSDDIISILLANPRTAEFICEKLWYEFVSLEKPEPRVIKSWASKFRSSNYDISLLLREILTSKEFWSESNKGALIKSPIDLVIGSLRTLDMEDGDLPLVLLYKQLKRMGQEIYAPPNVKGWLGGKAWIDDSRLLIRQRFLQRLTRGSNGVKKTSNNNNMMMKKKREMPLPELPDLSIDRWEEWLLAVPAITKIVTKKPQNKFRAIFLDPAYQLK